MATKSAEKKTAAKFSGTNRRQYPRFNIKGLNVTEISGDYAFNIQASNISEGGIFLSKRLATSLEPSLLKVRFSSEDSIELMAQVLHDKIEEDGFGAGYCFLQMTTEQTKNLRSLIKAYA